MPTGTRSSISANSATKPRTATASGQPPFRRHGPGSRTVFGMKDQPIGADGDQTTAETSPAQATAKNGQVGRPRS